METFIELKDIRFYAFHGVMEQERTVGNQFAVDVLLNVSLEDAMKTDNLDDTINYALIYEVIKAEMNMPSNLLEHVAGRILDALKKTFSQIKSIELKITKINPPIEGEVGSASVIVRQTY